MNDKKERIVWLDIVRLVAFLALICCHASDRFNYCPEPLPDNIDSIKWWGAFWGAAVRCCVPLFVMITGALLLPVTGDSRLFYKKRIGRVIWPFLIWSVLYSLLPWVVKLLGFGPDVVRDFFPFSSESSLTQTFGKSAGFIASIPLTFNDMDVHMWYIYMLVGLYLYMPVFSAWVGQASEKAKLWFLIAWGVTLFVPTIRHYLSETYWGACDWNEFYGLYYFAGFNGYLLLGHYLRNHIIPGRIVAVLSPVLFVLGFLITMIGFRHMASLPGHVNKDLELYWYFCSPQVMMMTFAVFAACPHVRIKSERIKTLLSSLTSCGFGIYMIHYLFTGHSVIWVKALNLPLGLQLPVATLIVLAISWTIVYFAHRILGQKAGRIIFG